MTRPWLLPLVPLWAAGVWWKNRGFARHPERAQRLTEPVVSVGSLSAGGAGKTPVVIALAEALRSAGVDVDVLSRGHGRKGDETLRVVGTGSAEEFGDEPLLMARRLGVPVYVARERYAAGVAAERDRRHRREDRAPLVHLMDDGFQHRRLACAVDVVLLTAEDAADALLPAGNLREPMASLRRADVVVLRAEEAEALRPVVARYFDGPVWVVRRRAVVVEGAVSAKALAFCGIARPEGFRAALPVAPVGLVALKDHQRYDAAVVGRLVARAKAAGADGVVTTAKDAVKLTPELRGMLRAVGPVAVVDVVVELEDAAARVAELRGMIAAWRGKSVREVR